MSKTLSAVILAAVILFSTACGGQSADKLSDNTANVQPGLPLPPTSLPAPSELDALHQASGLVETLIGGKFSLQRSAGAQEQGSALVLDASAGGPRLGSVPEWALYGFDSGSNDLDSLQVQLDVPEGSSAYILLADYASGRWELHGPYTALKTLLLDDPKYLSPGGTLYCTVLSPQGSSITVNALSVRTINPNNEAPTADLQASSLIGLIPFSIDFDASASTDPDGTIVEYAWDWDADGGYEQFSDQP
ncbi:hypothetical protein IT575_11170 [bacterium]|nr:hypothetical protein [bacterium]